MGELERAAREIVRQVNERDNAGTSHPDPLVNATTQHIIALSAAVDRILERLERMPR